MTTKASNNAIKTGAYSRETLLPWESHEDYEKLKLHILADLQPQGSLEMEVACNIVQNRWLRRRLQRTTAISTHRHAFGQKLVETGVGSWPGALKAVREIYSGHLKTLERIASSAQRIAQVTTKWRTSEQHEESADKVVALCQEIVGELTPIGTMLDEEADFFREYAPKQLSQRVKLENALDAQFDKLMARLTILREARKLHGRQDAGPSAGEVSHDHVETPPPSGCGGTGTDFAEMNRDDVEEEDSAEVEKRAKADQAARAKLSNARRNEDVVDPLVAYLQGDDLEPSESADAALDDGLDDWGMPKTPDGENI